MACCGQPAAVHTWTIMFTWLKLVASLFYWVCSILCWPILAQQVLQHGWGLFRCSAGMPDCLVFVDGMDLPESQLFPSLQHWASTAVWVIWSDFCELPAARNTHILFYLLVGFFFPWNMLHWRVLTVPWILVLWHPAELLQLVCLVMAVVCTFCKRLLEPSCCERLLGAVFVLVSSLTSLVVSSSSWKTMAGSVRCSCWELACLSFIQKQMLTALITKLCLYSCSWAELQVWLTAGKLRGSYLVEKRMLANENKKYPLGKHSMLPTWK